MSDQVAIYEQQATYNLYAIYISVPMFCIMAEPVKSWVQDCILIYNVQNKHTIIKYKCDTCDDNSDVRFNKICDSSDIIGTYKSKRMAAKHVNKLKKLNDGYCYTYVGPAD